MSKPNLSIVVPVKNEAKTLDVFLQKIRPVCDELDMSYELVFVDDGSTDSTFDALKEVCRINKNICVVRLSRNFGKELALSAGLDYCQGAAVIPMDVDLQDPPELISDLFAKYQEGYDVVIPVRREREGDSILKRIFAMSFHKIFRRLSDIHIYENAGDFRLISRRVVDVVKAMPERTRFMKGVLSWPGFETTKIEYDRPERSAGMSKWRFSSLWRLALDGLFSFSTLPLKVWTYIGFTLSFTSIVYMFFTIIKTMVYGVDLPGYASMMSVILLIGGVNLMGIGVVGEYVSRIFIEVKARPLYVVDEVINGTDVS